MTTVDQFRQVMGTPSLAEEQGRPSTNLPMPIHSEAFDDDSTWQSGSDMLGWQSWPCELLDSINWSAQFLGPAEDQSLNTQVDGADATQHWK